MNLKTVDLDEETYRKLLAEKKKDETITDVVKRLLTNRKQKSILKYAGTWDFSDEELHKLQKSLEIFRSEIDDML